MNRSPTTVTSYSYRAEKIILKILKEKRYRSIEELDLRSLPLWLANKKKELSKSSFRQYKAALLHYLGQVVTEEAAQAIDMLDDMSSAGSKKKGSHTSAKKLKRFKSKDIQRYDTWLVNNAHLKWSTLVRSWLVAGLITGLRPIEWLDAEVLDVDDEQGLRVINAKQTHGRAHGYDRILLLGHISLKLRVAIEHHIFLVQQAVQNVGDHVKFYAAISSFVTYTVRCCWARRAKYPTLYSLRHQCSANLKKAGYSKAEIAAIMGHATDATAGSHYAKKVSGEEIPYHIVPLPANVEKVRAKARVARTKNPEKDNNR